MDTKLRHNEPSSQTSSSVRKSAFSSDSLMKTHMHGQFSLHKVLSKFGCTPPSCLSPQPTEFSFDLHSNLHISSPHGNVKYRPSPSLPLLGGNNPSFSHHDCCEDVEAKETMSCTTSTFKQHSSVSLHSGMARGQHPPKHASFVSEDTSRLLPSEDMNALYSSAPGEDDDINDLTHSTHLPLPPHGKCPLSLSHYTSLCSAVQWLNHPHSQNDADYMHLHSILSTKSLLAAMDVCLPPAMKDALHHMTLKTITHYMPCRECEAPRQQAFSQLKVLLRKSMAAQLFVYGDFALKTYILPHSPVEACIFVSKTHEPQWMRRLINCLVVGKVDEDEEHPTESLASAAPMSSPSATSACSAAAIVGGEMRSQLSHMVVRMPTGTPDGPHFTPATIELGWASLRVSICCNDVSVLCSAALTQAVGEMRQGHALKSGIILSQLWAAAQGVLRSDHGYGIAPPARPQCPCAHASHAADAGHGVPTSTTGFGASSTSSLVSHLSTHSSHGQAQLPMTAMGLPLSAENDNGVGSSVKSSRSHAIVGISPLLPVNAPAAGQREPLSGQIYPEMSASTNSGRMNTSNVSGHVTTDVDRSAHASVLDTVSQSSQPFSNTRSAIAYPESTPESSTFRIESNGCGTETHSCTSSLARQACHTHQCTAGHSSLFTSSTNHVLSPSALRTLCIYVINAYYTMAQSPLDVLLRVLEVLASFDWRRHALTIYGPVSRSALKDGLLEPVREGACAWPVGVEPLVGDEVLTTHLLNKAVKNAYGPFLATGRHEAQHHDSEEAEKPSDHTSKDAEKCSKDADRPSSRALPSRMHVCAWDAMVILDACDPTVNVSSGIDKHGAGLITDAARTTLSALRHTLASTFAEVDGQGKTLLKTKRYDVALRGFVSGHASDSDSDNEDEEIASVNQRSVSTSGTHGRTDVSRSRGSGSGTNSISSASSRSHTLSLSPPPRSVVEDVCFRILSCLLPAQALECVCICGEAHAQPHVGLNSLVRAGEKNVTFRSGLVAADCEKALRVASTRITSNLTETVSISSVDAKMKSKSAPEYPETSSIATDRASTNTGSIEDANTAPLMPITPDPAPATANTATIPSTQRHIFMPGVGYVRLLSGSTDVASAVTALVDGHTSLGSTGANSSASGAGRAAASQSGAVGTAVDSNTVTASGCSCSSDVLARAAQEFTESLNNPNHYPVTDSSSAANTDTTSDATAAAAPLLPGSVACPCGGGVLVRGYVYGFTRSGRPKLSVTPPPACAAAGVSGVAAAGVSSTAGVAGGSLHGADCGVGTHDSGVAGAAAISGSLVPALSVDAPKLHVTAPHVATHADMSGASESFSSSASAHPESVHASESSPMPDCGFIHACSPDCDGVSCSVSYEALAVNVREARHFSTPDISSDALVNLVVAILKEKGPVPIGRMGSLLHVYTNNHSLPATLKETYGGLKRFLEKHRDKFFVGTDHPYNPHVTLVEHMHLLLPGAQQPEKKRRDKKTKDDRKKADGTTAEATSPSPVTTTAFAKPTAAPTDAYYTADHHPTASPALSLQSQPLTPFADRNAAAQPQHTFSALTATRAPVANERKPRLLHELTQAPAAQPTSILADIAQTLGDNSDGHTPASALYGDGLMSVSSSLYGDGRAAGRALGNGEEQNPGQMSGGNAFGLNNGMGAGHASAGNSALGTVTLATMGSSLGHTGLTGNGSLLSQGETNSLASLSTRDKSPFPSPFASSSLQTSLSPFSASHFAVPGNSGIWDLGLSLSNPNTSDNTNSNANAGIHSNNTTPHITNTYNMNTGTGSAFKITSNLSNLATKPDSQLSLSRENDRPSHETHTPFNHNAAHLTNRPTSAHNNGLPLNSQHNHGSHVDLNAFETMSQSSIGSHTMQNNAFANPSVNQNMHGNSTAFQSPQSQGLNAINTASMMGNAGNMAAQMNMGHGSQPEFSGFTNNGNVRPSSAQTQQQAFAMQLGYSQQQQAQGHMMSAGFNAGMNSGMNTAMNGMNSGMSGMSSGRGVGIGEDVFSNAFAQQSGMNAGNMGNMGGVHHGGNGGNSNIQGNIQGNYNLHLGGVSNNANAITGHNNNYSTTTNQSYNNTLPSFQINNNLMQINAASGLDMNNYASSNYAGSNHSSSNSNAMQASQSGYQIDSARWDQMSNTSSVNNSNNGSARGGPNGQMRAQGNNAASNWVGAGMNSSSMNSGFGAGNHVNGVHYGQNQVLNNANMHGAMQSNNNAMNNNMNMNAVNNMANMGNMNGNMGNSGVMNVFLNNVPLNAMNSNNSANAFAATQGIKHLGIVAPNNNVHGHLNNSNINNGNYNNAPYGMSHINPHSTHNNSFPTSQSFDRNGNLAAMTGMTMNQMGAGVPMNSPMSMGSSDEYSSSDTVSMHSGHNLSVHSTHGNQSDAGIGLGSGVTSTVLGSDQTSLYSYAVSAHSAHSLNSLGNGAVQGVGGRNHAFGVSGAVSTHDHGASEYGTETEEEKKKKKRVRKPKTRTETLWG